LLPVLPGINVSLNDVIILPKNATSVKLTVKTGDTETDVVVDVDGGFRLSSVGDAWIDAGSSTVCWHHFSLSPVLIVDLVAGNS